MHANQLWLFCESFVLIVSQFDQQFVNAQQHGINDKMFIQQFHSKFKLNC